jgi:hypothetical protein
MSGQPAAKGDLSPRVLLVEGDATLDVFELIELREATARVRTPYLFEIGEELRLQVERDGKAIAMTARVRGHTDEETPITELELERGGA